jgi:NAD-dependent SIR2 family protein deacetylase
MQIVKTRNHLIYSEHSVAPSHACLGQCGKVWWPEDVAERIAAAAVPTCPQCGGALTAAIAQKHYAIAVENAGPLKINGAQIKNVGLNIGR